MFIYNNKRVNIFTPFVGPDGTRYGNLQSPELRNQLGVIEVIEPSPPEDYTEDTYYKTEQDEAPYVVYTKKSDEQIAEITRNKALAKIAELEEIQLRGTLRMQRERELEAAEAYALSNLGLNRDQLYAAACQPDAPIAFITYKRMRELDDQIKQELNKL